MAQAGATPHNHAHDDAHDHALGDHAHEHHGAAAPDEGHGHHHGQLSASTPDALRVVIVSSLVLAAVAIIEFVISLLSGSAGVLADALHNVGDVSTTAALGTAFLFSRRAPSARFPYGYHRGEDLAGLVVLLLVIVSAIGSGIASVEHLLHQQQLTHLPLAFGAALVGVVGNEIVAAYKTSTGRKIGSVALVADGKHSRIDGLASLGAAIGVAGAWAGVPLLDPIAGLVITALIMSVAWDTATNVTARLLDEADSSLLETVASVAANTEGVVKVTSAATRWTGRKVWAEVTLEVDGTLTVSAAHAIGERVRHQLHHHVESLADVIVHLDPAGESDAHADTSHHVND